MDAEPYDAVLLTSFGGPERPEDVVPFLRNVTRGRDVPEARLLQVAEQYQVLGGRSPINDRNRELFAALREELRAHGIDVPVYWGNRNWDPTLEAVVRRMAHDGVRNALAFVTSAYSSYSGCRQYREDLERARAAAGDQAPRITKLRQYFNHPGFVAPFADGVRTAATELPGAHVVFTAHSIPTSMAEHCRYESQLRATARLVMEAADLEGPWSLAFQSRSGPPSVPWLEPDVNDHLRSLATSGAMSAIVVPIGFVTDHMEVLFDLDHTAATTAAELGMRFRRVPTPGIDPRFVAMARELVEEHVRGTAPLALGDLGPVGCRTDIACCPPPRHGRSVPGAAPVS